MNKEKIYEKTKRIMLIGFGPHARRIYFPLIEKFSEKMNFELAVSVDIESKKDEVEKYLGEKNSDIPVYYVPTDKMSYECLDKDVENILDDFVKRYGIEGVIIATEPLVHVMYAKWALKNNLSILMDKPVSTYKGISTNEDLAKKLVTDFEDLEKMYDEAKKRNPNITFSMMAQRRFHPAFNKIRELIRECYKKTNCPITSIQTFHCDGQWRMPSEIVDQLYHPYMQGYGKCSHSGYHFFDIVPFLLEAGLEKDKHYDNIDVFTNFVRPLDFMEQLTLKDYENIFGKEEFCKNNKYCQDELDDKMKDFGEIDAFSNIAFKKGDKTITLGTINLVHNGFAKRNWISAEGRDLYKGNGRIRHESHIIEQGPFQAIHYHSYQSEEVNPENNEGIFDVGGEYHLDIFVFRNKKMIGGKAVEKFNIRDFNMDIMEGKSRGHQEDARAKGFLEFIDALHGLKNCENMTSDFSTHKAAVMITSGIYQSAAAQLENKNPKINMKFKLGKYKEVAQSE